MTDASDTVKTLRGLGFSVIPSGGGKEGKAPPINWKCYQERLPTDAEYNTWRYDRKPKLWGIVTGAVSRVVIVDGDSADAMLVMGDLKPHVRTPRGGGHYYFEHPGHPVKTAAGLLPKIDIRGDGGFVNVIGTNPKNGGEYHIEILPTPEAIYPWDKMPEAILKEMNRSKPTTEPASEAELSTPIPEGQRNSTLTSYGGTMARRGMPLEAIEAALLEVNRLRCQPPLDGDEVSTIAKSVARYEPVVNIHRSDTGNAMMLVSIYGDKLRYDHKRKRWLRWGEHRWETDYDGHVSRLAQEVARIRYSRAAAISNLGEREREAKWAIASEHRNRVDACGALAGRMEPIADDGSNWDRDTMLLGAPNGIIDLHTGDLREGKAEDRITMSIGVNFDSSAECPLWMKFMNRVTDGDIELQEYLQRAVGYSLTGNTKSQVLFFLYGMGNNGKSTFIITIRKLLAEYGCRAGTDLFMLKDRTSGGPKESLANLENKRFVSASEIEEGRRLAVSLIKDMTGGETIVADRKFQHEVEYLPQYKVWLAGNHKPTISDTTLSIWRRVKLVPFTVTIPDSEIDYDLPANLEKELSGILNWAIKGCLEWQRRGLGEPEAVTESTKDYRQEQDTFARFIEDKCIEGPEETAAAGQAYTSYKIWAKGEGIGKFEMLSQTGFGIKMGERYKRKKSPGGQIYIGVRLKNPMVTMDLTED